MKTSAHPISDRLEAWHDGSAICVIAISSTGDPLDLADHEVEQFISRLKACLVESHALCAEKSNRLPQVNLRESWAITLRHLAASRYYLPEQLPTETARQTEESMTSYLHHNELGLALADAEAIGVELSPPSPYWHELSLAAISMNMPEAAARFAARNAA